MATKYCVYCNQEITTPSREHVIHNALGGLYESTDICCGDCNNYISRCIDKPFTTIFNPFIGRIQNFSKTNPSSIPPCTGTVLYNGTKYPANIKGKQVVSCPTLSRELKTDISKLPLEIVGYDFHIDNDVFKCGIAKIAFNYALDRGIDLNILKHGLAIGTDANGAKTIKINYPMVPFCPMNPVDEFLELCVPLELSHSMILFSMQNTLWCYIDLFNTFQYYVLLSDKYPQNAKPVYADYAQTIQKLNRDAPKLHIYDYKDIMIYAQQYNVAPCSNIEEFTKRIQNAINTRSQKVPLTSMIAKKFSYLSPVYLMSLAQNAAEIMSAHQAMHLYLDDQDQLQPRTFRILTPGCDGAQILPYPYAINEQIKAGQNALTRYTNAKFERLNRFLCQQTK